MTLFLNVAMPINTRDQLGLVLIGVIIFNILINLTLMVVSTIINSYKEGRRAWSMRKAN